MEIQTPLLLDGYKLGHVFQYPKDTTMVYSNLTPRSSRTGLQGVVAFGFQYFIQEYLINQFNRTFFWRPKDDVLAEVLRVHGAESVDLFVTHGIFSKGRQLKGIDEIYLTDSFNGMVRPKGGTRTDSTFCTCTWGGMPFDDHRENCPKAG